MAMKMREAEYSLEDFQRVCYQFEEVVDACREILAMIKSHLLLELPENARGRLETTEKLHQEVLKSFAEFKAGLEGIISHYRIAQSPSGVLSRQERDELQQKQQELVEKLSKEQKLVSELRSRLDEQSEEVSCKICMDNQANTAFLPCGHVCTCQACSTQMRGVCPVCRKTFTKSIRVYF